MTRKEAIDKIKELANELKNEPETIPAAAILNSLCGAMYINDDLKLLAVVVEFTKKSLEEINRLN